MTRRHLSISHLHPVAQSTYLEKVIKSVLFLLAMVSVMVTVSIVAVLLYEGVRFFTADFYEAKPTEVVATGEPADAVSQVSPATTAPATTPPETNPPGTATPGAIPRVSVRATTDSLIYVSWDRPIAGAPVSAYDVSILPILKTDVSDCELLGADRVSCVISDASPGRSYKVTVAAMSNGVPGVALQTKSFAVPESVQWQRYFTDTKWRTLLVPPFLRRLAVARRHHDDLAAGNVHRRSIGFVVRHLPQRVCETSGARRYQTRAGGVGRRSHGGLWIFRPVLHHSLPARFQR